MTSLRCPPNRGSGIHSRPRCEAFGVCVEARSRIGSPAPQGSGDRVFYESLLRENPDSLIAVRWHVEYGVFPPEKCEEMMAKLAELKEKDKERVTKILAKKGGLGTPARVPAGRLTPEPPRRAGEREAQVPE